MPETKTLGRVDWMPRLKVWRVIRYKGAADIPAGDYPTKEEAEDALRELVARGNPGDTLEVTKPIITNYNEFVHRRNLFNEGFNRKINDASIYAGNHQGRLSKELTGKVMTVREALSPQLSAQFPDEVLDTEIWFASSMNDKPFRGFALGTNERGQRIIIMHPEQAEGGATNYVTGLVHELKHRVDELAGKVVPTTGQGKYSDLIREPAERRARVSEKTMLGKLFNQQSIALPKASGNPGFTAKEAKSVGERLGKEEPLNNLLPMPPTDGPPLPRGLQLKWPWKK